MRSFIAVEVPQEIQNAITDWISGIRGLISTPYIRWVPQQNIHLTLMFLGEIPRKDLERLSALLKTRLQDMPSFEVVVSGIGVFPHLRRPRILWAGLGTPSHLQSLTRNVINCANQLGYHSSGKRDFSPHLTIGRIRQNITLSDIQNLNHLLSTTKRNEFGTFMVESIQIYKSDLFPSGAKYTHLVSIPFNGS